MNFSSCKNCKKPLSDHKKMHNAKYCSEKCRNEMNYNYKPINSRTSRSNIGAASELDVAADLLRRGYNCFRSISPNSPFDLIAYDAGELVKIEVKTGRKSDVTDNVAYPRPKHDDYDVLAIVMPDSNEIIYEPELDRYGWE